MDLHLASLFSWKDALELHAYFSDGVSSEVLGTGNMYMYMLVRQRWALRCERYGYGPKGWRVNKIF